MSEPPTHQSAAIVLSLPDEPAEVELRKEAKRAFDQALSDLGRRGNFSDKERAHILDAIEAIYRGER